MAKHEVDRERTTAAKTGAVPGSDSNLPTSAHALTSEVGGEGGSFGETQISSSPTAHAAEATAGGTDIGAYATRAGQIAEGGAGTDPGPDAGLVRYPTEAPPSETRRQPAGGSSFITGALAGIAAGAVVTGLVAWRYASRPRGAEPLPSD